MEETQPYPSTSVLFTPGERIGWTYRNRAMTRRAFSESEPDADTYPFFIAHRSSRLETAAVIMIMGFVYTLMCGGLATWVFSGLFDAPLFTGPSAVVVTIGAIICVLTCSVYLGMKRSLNRVLARLEEERNAWYARKLAFEQAEAKRLERIPEWGAVTLGPAVKRVDIVGGTLWGWEALMTVHGSALLATHGSMMVLDLSCEAVSRELLWVAAQNDVSIDALLLPHQLDQTDLLVGLSEHELVDSLVESIHSAEPVTSRSDRAVDHRILTAVCDVLGGVVTIRRLTAGLQALMGHPGELSALTSQERRRIIGELFSEEYRQQTHPRLQVLESFLHPLIGLGERQRKRPSATLTCLAMATDSRSTVRGELLTDLIVQRLIRRIASGTSGMSSLMIAGADKIPLHHLERLSDLCGRRNMRLVLLQRHLRGTAVQSLGGGTVGFMRLGNHEEATAAADFIGREHTFVLSQVNATLGGNDTHSSAESRSEAHAVGGQSGTSWGLGVTGLFGKPSAGVNWTRSESKTWNLTRNWSVTRGRAEGMNWSRSVSAQRVREYTVEPQQLQDLPEYAMLLIGRHDGVRAVVPVECNPDLISLPRVSMNPLPSTSRH